MTQPYVFESCNRKSLEISLPKQTKTIRLKVLPATRLAYSKNFFFINGQAVHRDTSIAILIELAETGFLSSHSQKSGTNFEKEIIFDLLKSNLIEIHENF